MNEISGKTNVFIISGFLGSGKTTLLKRIIDIEENMAGTVILVNEFGEIGVDKELLNEAGTDVIELASGCICCTIVTELRNYLKKIWERYHPSRLFIETSGISDPKNIIDILKEDPYIKRYSLKKIVTVLDVNYWKKRELFGTFFENQLKCANLILLNKIDRIDKDEIAKILNEMNVLFRNSQIIPTVHCKVNPELIFEFPDYKIIINNAQNNFLSGDFKIETMINHPLTNQPESIIGSKFKTFIFEESRPLNFYCFKKFIEELPHDVFRVKGKVFFTNKSNIINYDGKSAEWLPLEKAGITQLVFIGWGIKPQEIINKLYKCIIKEN